MAVRRLPLSPGGPMIRATLVLTALRCGALLGQQPTSPPRQS